MSPQISNGEPISLEASESATIPIVIPIVSPIMAPITAPIVAPKVTDKITNTAPYRILNWVVMQDTVNTALEKCSVCETNGIKLVEVSQIILSSTFQLECETCNNRKEKLRQHLYYLQKNKNQIRHVTYT